jgi:predicted porin
LNRYRKDALAYSYANKHFNSGFGLQVAKFSDTRLGSALNLSYFMEPFIWERERFSIRLRCAGGLNLASNPYDSITNKLNDGYSSHVNGYLGLGFSAWYQINANMSFFLDGTYSHFSNGNTKNPNLGINYPNLGIGLEYRFKPKQKPLGKLLFYDNKWRTDFALYGSNKSLPIAPTKRFWTYGAHMLVSYRTGKLHAFTLGTEFYIDESMRYAMDNHNIYGSMNLDNKFVGLLGGHEFLFNRCIFSQQLGVYIYKEVPEEFVNRVYHRWGFHYKLSKNWMVGINLNANLQKAFLFDARLVYSMYY